MKQARYSPRNLGHFGLRSPRYCHFTSPIRRYPDLICHRALLTAIGAGEATVRASDLEAAGEWCSARERDAMAIERAADNVARAFLLERELFEERGWQREFAGEVAGVIGAGAFVAFDGYEGLLPVRRLRGDWWELDELETMLIGAESGKRIRLGDPVRVQVERVDAPRAASTCSRSRSSDAGRSARARSGRPSRRASRPRGRRCGSGCPAHTRASMFSRSTSESRAKLRVVPDSALVRGEADPVGAEEGPQRAGDRAGRAVVAEG